MIATAKVKDPGEVKVTMTITMTVGSWKAIRDELSSKYLPNKFREKIRHLIDKVERTLYDESEL